jgi:uncharacterized protein DUF2637
VTTTFESPRDNAPHPVMETPAKPVPPPLEHGAVRPGRPARGADVTDDTAWWRRWWRRSSGRSGRLGSAALHPDADDDAVRLLHLVHRSRRLAVWLTVGIAAVSFVLSFTSLRELAAMSAWPGWQSWLWPLVIDGTIVLATLGIVALAPYRNQFWNRLFLWAVLAAAALVSVGGNALHAWLATEHLAPWMRAGSAGLACVPPVALLATTHILAILWRFNPTRPADETQQVQAGALRIAAERVAKWDAVAATIHEQGFLPSQPTAKIAEVLRFLYDRRPAMSLRAIGAQVGLHHDTVGKIRDAAGVVVGAAGGGDR